MHTATFTHRCVYTQTLLLTDSFAHRSFYSQMRLYTQTHLHTHTHATFYVRSPKIRTNALSHKETFTSRPCYIQTLLHGRRGETSQLIGSLQEQKLARKKITESDDCLSSSSILPAQKDDATFLFWPDGRATKPSGFHTASKKKLGTHWPTASITLKPKQEAMQSCVDRAAGRLKLTTKCC